MSKQSKSKSNVPVFNRSNAKKFAKNIYTVKDGKVSFLQLCDGDLKDGKVGKRHLHCAIGEALVFFGPNRKKVARLLNSGSVDSAIGYLVDNAALSDEGRPGHLADVLSDIVSTNDDVSDKDQDMEYLLRAQKVSEFWMENVVPLLKN